MLTFVVDTAMAKGIKRSKDLIRTQIVTLRQNGLSSSRTARLLRISVEFVKNWQKRYVKTEDVKDEQKVGRPKILSRRA